MLRQPAVLAIAGVVTGLLAFMVVVFVLGNHTSAVDAPQPLVIQVEQGESLSHFVRRLAEARILNNPELIRGLAVLRGDTTRIKAGEYVLNGVVTPNELLDYLVSGKARYLALTVPEGFSMFEVAQRVEQKEAGSAAEFLRLARDREFIAGLALPFAQPPASLEGLLYPETYFFHRGVGEARLIDMMVAQFRKRALPLLQDQAARMGLTPYEALTLASIIEKETGTPQERPLIAAVFHNRLRARMTLGSDPTVIYGLEHFDGNLTREQLRTRTDYNTYVMPGLPPTPIANPGLPSIRAALEPAQVKYLYFVSKGDGSHFFSADYRTHTRAVYKYQKQPNRRPNS
ncbi:MAG: endolytic transglycosylase MltG [Candidatus Lambdaproteobacteria bacterium]|nr:endolytic transglycosylase MltG [Candidatus Lambdaproteobacteria bacterium]